MARTFTCQAGLTVTNPDCCEHCGQTKNGVCGRLPSLQQERIDVLSATLSEMIAALEEHVAAHDKIARDAQFTRCGCFSCDSFRDALAAAKAVGIKKDTQHD